MAEPFFNGRNETSDESKSRKECTRGVHEIFAYSGATEQHAAWRMDRA
jgi:hypothetical protein